METQVTFFDPHDRETPAGTSFVAQQLLIDETCASGFALRGLLGNPARTIDLDLRILVNRKVLPDNALQGLRTRVLEDPARALKWLRSLTDAHDLGIL